MSHGLEEPQRLPSGDSQPRQSSASDALDTAQAPGRAGTSVDAGVQTTLSGDYVPAKRKRKRRRNACGCCFNKWTASFVAVAAIFYASRQPVCVHHSLLMLNRKSELFEITCARLQPFEPPPRLLPRSSP